MVMSDENFSELKFQVQICPEMAAWPESQSHITHWKNLRAVTDEARGHVRKALTEMDKVDTDINLTTEGKTKTRARIAEKALAEIKVSKTLDSARSSVEMQMQKWKAKVDEVIKPAEDARTVALHAEIRGRVANMSREDRLTFFQKHSGDLQVAAALLTAPAFLSNVTEAECALLRSRVEQSVLSSEILEARTAVTKALADAERGWSRAIALVSERGGIVAERKGLKAA